MDKVREDARLRDLSFKQNLNDLVRAGLEYRAKKAEAKPYRVRATAMGQLPGLNYDDIGALLDFAEGEHRR